MADMISVTGQAQLRAALARATVLAIPALTIAALEEMEIVMAEAKAMTPVDLGILRDSGHVLPPKVSPTSVEITAGFGGAASDYAIVQHERLDYNHPSGGPKFLERPFMARLNEMPKRLAAGVGLALRRLGV